MHILNSVPFNSSVTVWACGRHPQGRVTCRTGSVKVFATPSAYPLKVSIRPSAVQGAKTPGGFKNFGQMVEGDGSILARLTTGHDIDFAIKAPEEFAVAGSPLVMTGRHASRALADIGEVSPVDGVGVDVYARKLCSGCSAPIDTGALCHACLATHAPELTTLCTTVRKTEAGIFECREPRHAALTICRSHALESGLIQPDPVVPDAARCVWSGCTSARYKAYVMCAEHAIEAGLVVQAAGAQAAGPLKVVGVVAVRPKRMRRGRPKRDSLAPASKRGGTAVHKLDCACVICKHAAERTQAAAVAAGKAEAAESQ